MLDQFTWTDLINPEFYIMLGGLWLVLLIVFAETGLFIGFFFPGDSLLFVSGIYAEKIIKESLPIDNANYAVWILILLTALSAILGNILGYRLGKSSKNFFYHAPDRWYYKKKYIQRAHDFYEKHGGLAISLARFLPIIRTFVPIVGGIVDMSFRKFLFYTIIGGILWPLIMQLAGYYLNHFLLSHFNIDIKNHVEAIVIGIIIVSTIPLLINFLKRRLSKKVA